MTALETNTVRDFAFSVGPTQRSYGDQVLGFRRMEQFADTEKTEICMSAFPISPALLVSYLKAGSWHGGWHGEAKPKLVDEGSELVVGPSGSVSGSPAEDLRARLFAELDRAKEDAEAITAEEGRRPPDEAFRDASAFIELLPPDLPAPSIWASGDGEVGFTWSKHHGAKGFVEVAFCGEGRIEWAADFGDACVGGTVTVDLARATRLPRDLERCIDRLRAQDPSTPWVKPR